MEEYKGYHIEEMFGIITVQYMGDELVFNSVKEAKEFIDEIHQTKSNKCEK